MIGRDPRVSPYPGDELIVATDRDSVRLVVRQLGETMPGVVRPGFATNKYVVVWRFGSDGPASSRKQRMSMAKFRRFVKEAHVIVPTTVTRGASKTNEQLLERVLEIHDEHYQLQQEDLT